MSYTVIINPDSSNISNSSFSGDGINESLKLNEVYFNNTIGDRTLISESTDIYLSSVKLTKPLSSFEYFDMFYNSQINRNKIPCNSGFTYSYITNGVLTYYFPTENSFNYGKYYYNSAENTITKGNQIRWLFGNSATTAASTWTVATATGYKWLGPTYGYNEVK